MAQLDPSIILQARQPQIESPMNALAQMMQVQGMQQQNQLGQMKMDEARTAGERRNKLAALLQGKYETPEAMEDAVLRGGYMDEAAQLRKSRSDALKAKADTGKTGAETEKIQIATQREKLGLVGQLLNGVKDQATYDQARVTAQQNGLDVSNMPPQYDPNMVAQKLQQALTVEEKLAQVWKQKGYDLDVQKFGETKRSNLAGEGLQRRGQDITVRGQNLTDARGRESNDIARTKAGAAGPDGRPSKPMPATALKMQNEALDVIGIASSIQADLGTIEQQLEKGKLDFGPVKNVANNLKNMAGMSDEQSRNFSTFKSSMEKLRNDSLRLNKGVQTDGDAQRAWNELFQNINDKGLVKQRLAEIKAINARAVDLRKREVEDIRNNYNQQQYDFSGQTNVPSAITPPSGGANIDALLEKYK